MNIIKKNKTKKLFIVSVIMVLFLQVTSNATIMEAIPTGPAPGTNYLVVMGEDTEIEDYNYKKVDKYYAGVGNNAARARIDFNIIKLFANSANPYGDAWATGKLGSNIMIDGNNDETKKSATVIFNGKYNAHVSAFKVGAGSISPGQTEASLKVYAVIYDITDNIKISKSEILSKTVTGVGINHGLFGAFNKHINVKLKKFHEYKMYIETNVKSSTYGLLVGSASGCDGYVTDEGITLESIKIEW